MSPFSIFLIITFTVLIVVFVILTVKNKSKNGARHNANVIIPFAGYLNPPNGQITRNPNNVGTLTPTENGLYLVGMGGGLSNNSPQIQCPVGSKINIIGAFIETNDPFGECSGNPSALFRLSCGSRSDTSSAPLCSYDSDCAQGMSCDPTGRCLPKNDCTIHGDCVGSGPIAACPDQVGTSCSEEGGFISKTDDTLICRSGIWVLNPAYGQCMMCDKRVIGGVTSTIPGTNGVCKNIPLCINVDDSKTQLPGNNTCGDDANRCKIRDASAHLAAKCDGKNQCLGDPSDVWMPNAPGGHFGPLPCDIPASASNIQYQNLPVIPGWNNGTPPAGTSSRAPASFSQGYYVHGIYTCIPDDELTTS